MIVPLPHYTTHSPFQTCLFKLQPLHPLLIHTTSLLSLPTGHHHLPSCRVSCYSPFTLSLSLSTPGRKNPTPPGHTELGNIETGIMPQAPSTRWCPTPEQLMILEEMYRSGIRTPNASQIQQITAHLSYYGKIEGKNVFYWFQNHKARDRQKLRRRLSRHQQLLQQHQNGQPPHPQFLHQLDIPPHPTCSPHHAPYHQPPPPQFLQQGSYPDQASPVMNLVCKLDSCGGREGEMERSMAATSSMGRGNEWMMMMDVSPPAAPPCCRPLKTLDLFPIKSTGLLRDEYNTSKSSSCSTSTTN